MGSSVYSPQNREELFNLRHASGRNVVERIFGVVKKRFKILVYPPEFSMDIQAQIPPALCAIHNFIREHDRHELTHFDEDTVDLNSGGPQDWGTLMSGTVQAAEKTRADARRDVIAEKMWQDYQAYLAAQRLQ